MNRGWKTRLLIAGTGVLLAAPPPEARAQDRPLPTWARPVELRDLDVPFEPGERLEYKVKLGWFNAGNGSLTVAGIDTVRGHPTYHAVMRIDGGLAFARVHDQFDTWFGTRDLVSHRFIQEQEEMGSERFRHYEMYPDSGVWVRQRNGEVGDLASQLPLDDISFMYFVRTIPLEVGETYTFDRYFKDSGNPVVLQVLRRERKEVPAGVFNTIVVRPIIKTKGLFSEGGEAELYFTDDERRILVYMRSNVPVLGSLTLHLEGVSDAGLPEGVVAKVVEDGDGEDPTRGN